ncbi:MAG: Ferredoxin [Methanomassiliicoccales archaeon PtaU1.Bin124]|nr:MAG: Ferredoxin [Methanomassiliicoccales archaeon PtaU1.Bin124]
MIFYFSATGNSLEAATVLGESLDERTIDITEAMRKKEFSYALPNGERIGFVFPVFFFGVPSIVCDFIDRLELKGVEHPYVFSVITCGEKIGAADKQFQKIIQRKGLDVNVCFTLIMPNNSVLWYELPTPEEQRSMLAAARIRMGEIAQAVKENGTDGYASTLGARINAVFMYSLYKHGRRTLKFHADERCTGCGLCGRVCPCGAIELRERRPVWVQDRCVQCLGCINRCPATAIQYGEATRSRRRYVNPILKR